MIVLCPNCKLEEAFVVGRNLHIRLVTTAANPLQPREVWCVDVDCPTCGWQWTLVPEQQREAHQREAELVVRLAEFARAL